MAADPSPADDAHEQAFAELVATIGDTARREVLRALSEMGVSLDELQRAAEGGHIDDALFDALLVPERAERRFTPEMIEAEGGPPSDHLAKFMAAFGLPAPDGASRTFTQSEADALVELGRLDDLFPLGAQLQLARLYGDALARVARVEAALFRLYVERPMRAVARDPIQSLGAVRRAVEHLRPITGPLLAGMHERWIEHELAQAAVGEAQDRMSESGVPGATHVTLLFCDLSGFTAYSEWHGDEAAVNAIDRFAAIVHDALGDEGRVVKELGDGQMLAFPEPGPAVATAARILDEVKAGDDLYAHASVHHGVAVYRSGDYFGRSVNLAARLLAVARPDELIATRPVVEATREERDWIPCAPQRIRGVPDPVPAYRLDRASAG